MTPRTDHDRLQRLLKVARNDGWGLIAISGPSAVLAALGGDFGIAAAATGVTAAGLLELSGHRLLVRGSPAGLPRLWLAQLCALSLILAYAHFRWQHAADAYLLRLLPAFTRDQLDLLFPDPHALRDWLRFMQRVFAGGLAVGALLFQGGLAVYYLRSGRAVRRALAAPPAMPAPEKSR